MPSASGVSVNPLRRLAGSSGSSSSGAAWHWIAGPAFLAAWRGCARRWGLPERRTMATPRRSTPPRRGAIECDPNGVPEVGALAAQRVHLVVDQLPRRRAREQRLAAARRSVHQDAAAALLAPRSEQLGRKQRLQDLHRDLVLDVLHAAHAGERHGGTLEERARGAVRRSDRGVAVVVGVVVDFLIVVRSARARSVEAEPRGERGVGS